MNERSQWITKLKEDVEARSSYIRAKLDVLLPAQIRALRLRHDWKQEELASEADMKQSRISAMERPGAVNFNLETLVRVAAAFRVGLVVKFAPFGEMLSWENGFRQDSFDVTRIEDDREFGQGRPRIGRRSRVRNARTFHIYPRHMALQSLSAGEMHLFPPLAVPTGTPEGIVPNLANAEAPTQVPNALVNQVQNTQYKKAQIGGI